MKRNELILQLNHSFALYRNAVTFRLLRPLFVLTVLFLNFHWTASGAPPTKTEVLAAMRKATDFMMNRVSNRGGFLWHYSEDLSQGWGEVPARKSQIWVQPPSTPTVGRMLLAAYEATGDRQYLEHAEKVAGALIWGQHPSGGWHYFIDFDMSGVRHWYREEASRWRGWEEFYHYYGNCTYDDDTTTSPTQFLLELYITTLDPKYRKPLFKALGFILQSQYPNGSWPQRYPLSREFPFEGRPDYTSYYTFNDDVTSNNIYLLLKAYEKLGDEKYLKAARRGMDFYILSQLPSPQAGWATQYDMDMKPAWGRSYEPAAVCLDQTIGNIEDLENFYRITGDKRYLEPISRAIEWLEYSVINTDPSKDFTHANFCEVGTNKPLVIHHEHRRRPDGKLGIVRYWVDSELGEEAAIEREMPVSASERATGYHLGIEFQDSHFKTFSPSRIDIEAMKKRLKEYLTVPFAEIRTRHGKGIERPMRFSDRRAKARADSEGLQELISSMDARGAWLTEIEFLDKFDFTHNPPTRFRGIDTGTYVSNMYKLINFLKSNSEKK
ncbi:hypothetical protein MYX78_00130 [Acidobacteria bacterium AH-259-G07]|nr:hypothetical protein [Acidobacteria bacterium AH-259-G07]